MTQEISLSFVYPEILALAKLADQQAAPGVLGAAQAVNDTDFPGGPCKSLLAGTAVSVSVFYPAAGGGYVQRDNVPLQAGYNPLYGAVKVAGITTEVIWPLY